MSSSLIEPPTKARLGVLAFLCSLTFVLYLDRVCIGQALAPIQKELNLSNQQMSWVLNAFLLAYAIFEVPTGRWGDRYGSRRVLIRIVIWWSLFTALTGAIFGFWSLMAVRFLFGAGEAGAYPNAARVIRRWFPQTERGRVQGLMLASAGIGGAISPVVAGYIIESFGWRSAFVCFGAVGLLWVVAFWIWFRDDPAEHPQVNAAERELLAGQPGEHQSVSARDRIPWMAAVKNRNVWLLGAITSSGAFCSYLYYSWYSKYMQAARGVSPIEAAWLSSLVLAGGVVGLLTSGWVADWLVHQSANLRRSRRRFGFTAGLSAAILLLAGVSSQSPWTTAAFTSASCLMMSLPLANWWSVATEISGRHLGALFGLLNTMGVAGGVVSQYFFGTFADLRAEQGFTHREQWDPAFYVYAAVLVFGGICWLFVDPTKRVEDSPGHCDEPRAV